MARREFTRKVKAAALSRAAGKCEKCTATLKPREGEVDHILPDILGGEPVLANAQVLCRVCHDAKTANDIRRTRKADRQRDKASGAIRPGGKIPSPPKPERPASKALPPRRSLFGARSARMCQVAKGDADHG
ncbi:HNH endonuclease [Mesorhizobium australicum]|uniref:HNH endonuclease n=1 Tax=Mesorhizobium australicum TaxID=536018 RepID=UPI0033391940